jgi:hypothetical protein
VTATFLKTSSLTADAPEEVEAGLAHVSAFDQLYFGDYGGINWEDTLNTDTVADLTYGESLSETFATSTQDNSLEHLDAFFARVQRDSSVHFYSVTGAESRDIVTAHCVF